MHYLFLFSTSNASAFLYNTTANLFIRFFSFAGCYIIDYSRTAIKSNHQSPTCLQLSSILSTVTMDEVRMCLLKTTSPFTYQILSPLAYNMDFTLGSLLFSVSSSLTNHSHQCTNTQFPFHSQ